MTITGYVGRVIQLLPHFGRANINQHIARIRITAPHMLPEFVAHMLNQDSFRRHYASILTGQAYPQISLKQVRETALPAPSIREQKAITRILGDLDDELECIEERLAKARQIKQGMMQELLSGRIRLV
jgi:type I restriction enzyme S subunit